MKYTDYYLAIMNYSGITKIDLSSLSNTEEIFDELRHPLHNIDIFTSYFSDVDELIMYLRQNGVNVPAGELIIVNDKGQKQVKVTGIIYKGDTYLFENSQLEQKYLDMMRQPYFIESILKYISNIKMFEYQVNVLKEYLNMMKAKRFDNRLFQNAKGALISINGYLLYGNRKPNSSVNYRYLHLLVSIYKDTTHRNSLLLRVNNEEKKQLASEFSKLVDNDSMTLEEYTIHSENLKDMQQKRRMMMEGYLHYLQETDDTLTFEEYQQMSNIACEVDFSSPNPLKKIK